MKRLVPDLPDGCTGKVMKSATTPVAQAKLKDLSGDKFALLEKRLKAKEEDASGFAAQAMGGSPPKKARMGNKGE